jgi:hypothetical protein
VHIWGIPHRVSASKVEPLLFENGLTNVFQEFGVIVWGDPPWRSPSLHFGVLGSTIPCPKERMQFHAQRAHRFPKPSAHGKFKAASADDKALFDNGRVGVIKTFE